MELRIKFGLEKVHKLIHLFNTMLYTIISVAVSIAIGILSFSFVSSQLQLRNRLKEVAKYVPKESIFKGKKILVLLNPIGGDGKGLPAWNQFVEPMLKKAQIQYELVITKRTFHNIT